MRDRWTTKGLVDLIFHVKTAPGGAAIHTVVEVGSYAGQGTYIFCEHFPEVHAVDTWDYHDEFWAKNVQDGDVTLIEKHFDTCVEFWGPEQLTKHKGQSVEIAKTWPRELPIDLLYIDADHSYEAVKADFMAWIPLVRPGCWVCGHDYDHPDFPGVRKAVDETFNHVVLFRDQSWAARLT